MSRIAYAVAALGVIGGSSGAQRAAEPPLQLVTTIERDDGTLVQLGGRARGFHLFADADLAGAPMHLTGRYRWAQFNANGLCPFANTAGDLFNSSCGGITGAGGGIRFFHLQAAWGVPISEYRKIRQVWPNIVQMKPPIGYSTPWRITSIQPLVTRIGPADNQFGTYFSGVVGEAGAGCRDISGVSSAGFPNGLTLTATSDCPETWGPGGYDGIRAIPDDAWLAAFAENPMSFRWDDWRLSAALTDGAPLLGTKSTYGAFSDHTRDVLAQYGAVTPFASGQPIERGYPLGITVRYDAFRFDRPILRDGVFIRWYVINNSADVWGHGIDYDSLHMGVDPAYTTRRAGYNDVRSGAHIQSRGNQSGRCGGTYPRRVGPGATQGCVGASTSMSHVIMVLKSPIGDIRNKLFSDPASAFYAPNHPEADDTITFNHWRRGDFGAQEEWAWRYSDRSLYGFMAGDEERYLDGRTPDFMSAPRVWLSFAYEFTDGTNGPQNWRWNRSVPGAIPGYGKWDYNEDGIQDTLKLPDCGVNGCAARWSDTIAGGFSNGTNGNLGNWLGVGPFSLKAGDTTSFIWFLGTGGVDTLENNRFLQAVTEMYLGNYKAAVAYPAVTLEPGDVQITSAWKRDTATTAGTEIRLRLRTAAPRDDPYFTRVLERLEGDEPIAVALRRLNPALVETVKGRMRQNLAEVLVFKSCDRGATWTADTDCVASTSAYETRAQDGTRLGLGWQPRFIARADTLTGALATPVVSEIVQSGREYLYATVTRTRGLRDIDVTTELTVDPDGRVLSETRTSLEEALGIDADSVTGTLATSGPTTITVYAPLTETAGSVYARIDTATVQGSATQLVRAVAASRDVEGSYRLRFGNRFIVTRTVDTITNARTTTVIRQSMYSRAALGPGQPALLNFVASADTFASNHGLTTTGFGFTLSSTPATVVGTRLTFVDTLTTSSFGYVLARSGGAGAPLILANGTSGVGPSFETDSYFPGFTVSFPTVSAPQNWIVRTPGDTLVPAAPDANAPHHQGNIANLSRGGYYRLRWRGDSYGPGAPFSWAHPASMQAALTASLQQRPLATITTTETQGVPDFLTVSEGRGLLSARVPFEVWGADGRPAELVMFQRNKPGDILDSLRVNSRLFGSGVDTVRLAVPADLWLPGDTLYFLERVRRDSVVFPPNDGLAAVVVRDTVIGGRTQRLPIQIEERRIGLRLVLTCDDQRTCNALRPGSIGATSYLAMQDGWETVVHFLKQFDQNSDLLLTATPHQIATRPLTGADVSNIHVVPNPYVVMSAYDAINENRITTASRVMFVNVPLEGVLRVYSISGQLMRQLTWTANDLTANGGSVTHGDLPFDLRTTDGREMGAGLYLYVLTGKSPNASGVTAKGKFVVIR